MSLLMKATSENTNNDQVTIIEEPSNGLSKDEMTLVMNTVNEQKSSMSDELKEEKRRNVESLEALLHDVIDSKGEADSLNLRRNSNNEFEVEGLSNMTLHTFLLKAEALGKNIKYTKTLKVEICD